MLKIIRDFPTSDPVFATAATHADAYRMLRRACGPLVKVSGGYARRDRATERYLIVPV